MLLVNAPFRPALGDIKELLARALDEAKAIDELVVAYFIEMAIAEVRERCCETQLKSVGRPTLVRTAD